MHRGRRWRGCLLLGGFQVRDKVQSAHLNGRKLHYKRRDHANERAHGKRPREDENEDPEGVEQTTSSHGIVIPGRVAFDRTAGRKGRERGGRSVIESVVW